MSVEHLVVVGASVAGARAVEVARKEGFAGRVTLIGEEIHLPYDRPPLSKAVLDRVEGDALPQIPYLKTLEGLTTALGIELRLGSPATALDSDARTVVVDGESIEYDKLIVATGCRARRLVPGSALGGVHTLRTLDDAMAIRSGLDLARNVVIIGAGFIGSEVASAARKRGLAVSIVEAGANPFERALGSSMGGAVARLHGREGVDLRTGTSVEALVGESRIERVNLTDGTSLDADLVVVGIGAEPSVDWLESSQVSVDNGVVCDENLESSVAGIYAAGDVARWFNPAVGRHMRIEHRSSAAEQGAAAARNAVGAESKPYSTVPYFWSDWYDSRIQFVGDSIADEVAVVNGSTDEGSWVALYRRDDLLIGALAVNRQAEAMRYRGLIKAGASWSDGLAAAEERRERAQHTVTR